MNIQNLLQKRLNTSIIARIDEKSTNTLFIVKDLKGRKFRAESDGSYKVGQVVRVESGVIINKTKMPKSIKHFNV